MRLFRLILLCLMLPFAAMAQGFDEIAAALPDGSYEDRAARVSALAASGDPRAEALLQALAAGDLAVLKADGQLVVVSGDQARNAQAQHQPVVGHFVHVEHHATGEGQCRGGADQRPDVGGKDVIIVVLRAGHVGSCLFVASP